MAKEELVTILGKVDMPKDTQVKVRVNFNEGYTAADVDSFKIYSDCIILNIQTNGLTSR